MIVKEYLKDRMKGGPIHLSLLDPATQSHEEAGRIAKGCKDAGTDAIMIGGSTGVTSDNLMLTAKAIKDSSGLPTIHFPGDPRALSTEVDSIFFMSLVNSSDPFWIMRAQAASSGFIKRMGVETISLGYIIIEPGMKVGEVGKAIPIKQDNPEEATGYAMACEMLGMDFVYLEAGSGADRPVPASMISMVSKNIEIPLIVGGGIRTPEAARAARLAGANAIVTGTFLERCSDFERLKSVIDACKGFDGS